FHSIIRALVPSYGVVELERAIVNILAVIERIEQHTADAISASLQEEVDSLSHAVMQNKIVLNFILAAQGGVCAIVNTTCCSYVDQSGRIKKDLD
ncbi:ERVV2 protein, partial [Lanius ludovicianus]|nr:ERVV2 protein [Lanius ludovicianus]